MVDGLVNTQILLGTRAVLIGQIPGLQAIHIA